LPRAGFHGFRFDSHSRKFGAPSRHLYPQDFNLYLDKLSARLQDSLFKPDPSISVRGEHIKRMLTQNGVKASTMKEHHRTGFFGYSFRDKSRTVNHF
jgi:hypothetical protein